MVKIVLLIETEKNEFLVNDILVNKSQKKKKVTFRLGADGNEWCWVMGETPDDNK